MLRGWGNEWEKGIPLGKLYIKVRGWEIEQNPGNCRKFLPSVRNGQQQEGGWRKGQETDQRGGFTQAFEFHSMGVVQGFK